MTRALAFAAQAILIGAALFAVVFACMVVG